MKIETKIQLEHRIKKKLKNALRTIYMKEWKYTSQIYKKKNRTKNVKNASKVHTIGQERHNNLQQHVFNKNTNIETQ